MLEIFLSVFGAFVGYFARKLEELRKSKKERRQSALNELLGSVSSISRRALEMYTLERDAASSSRTRLLTILTYELNILSKSLSRRALQEYFSMEAVAVAYKRFHDAATNDNVKDEEFPLGPNDTRVRRLHQAESAFRNILEDIRDE